MNFNTKKKKAAANKGFTLIEILIVIGIIAILAAIVIIAINPAKQFAQARNTQRTANVNAILNGIGQYIADNKGILPAEITTSTQDISSGGADLCSLLVPTYLPALVVDPIVDPDGASTTLDQGEAIPEASCGGTYNTGYTVEKDSNQRISVCAPNAVEPAIPGATDPICVTR